MSAPTAPELEVLKEFRSKVTDLGLEKETDLSMLRWLRARELNLDQAEDMLRKHVEYRKEQNLDEILDWAVPDFIKQNYPFEITGRDKEGRPICVIPFGSWDMRKAVKAEMQEQFLRNINLIYEQLYAKMKENSLEFKSEITQCVMIIDYAHFSMTQLTTIAGLNMLLEAFRRFESNNPEMLYRLYALNSFRVFQAFLAIVKPFLSERTLSKFEIYTTSDKWIPVLRENLPHDQFPAEYGGTRPGKSIAIGSGLEFDMIDDDDDEITMEEILAAQETDIL